MHFIGEDQRHGFQSRLVSDIHGKMHRALTDWDTKDGWGTKATASGWRRPGPGDYLYCQYDDCVATRAAEYLAEPERKDGPWALCVGLITPHFPLIVREKYWNMYYPRHADLPDIPGGPPRRAAPAEQAAARSTSGWRAPPRSRPVAAGPPTTGW